MSEKMVLLVFDASQDVTGLKKHLNPSALGSGLLWNRADVGVRTAWNRRVFLTAGSF